MAETDGRGSVHLDYMVRVKHQIVNDWHGDKCWADNLTRENPLIFVQNWVPRCDLKAVWHLTNVRVSILLKEFGDTFHLGATENNVSFLQLFDWFGGSIFHLDERVRTEATAASIVIIIHVDRAIVCMLRLLMRWGWRRH